jgi:hypothetical protein
MKLEIQAPITEIELANFLLEIAYREAIQSTVIQKQYNIRPEQLVEAEKFRVKLVEAYLSTADKNTVLCAE